MVVCYPLSVISYPLSVVRSDSSGNRARVQCFLFDYLCNVLPGKKGIFAAKLYNCCTEFCNFFLTDKTLFYT